VTKTEIAETLAIGAACFIGWTLGAIVATWVILGSIA